MNCTKHRLIVISGLAVILIAAMVWVLAFKNSATQTRNSILIHSGINGIVTMGPTCPVQRVNDESCADRPLSAAFDITTLSGKLLKRVRSDDSGHFTVTLSPGNYIIRSVASGSGLPRPENEHTPVSVAAGKFTDVHLQFDSGIR